MGKKIVLVLMVVIIIIAAIAFGWAYNRSESRDKVAAAREKECGATPLSGKYLRKL